jgi:hypothetical protein
MGGWRRRCGGLTAAIALLVTGWVAASPASAALFQVTTEAEFRTALTTLSSTSGSPNRIIINADFSITGATDPTYTGSEPLTILGMDHVVTSSPGRRILLNAGGPGLTIEHLTFRGGDAARGGAIRSEGTGAVTLDHTRFQDNTAASVGGAVDVFGDLTVTDSVFVRNHADLGAAIRARNLVLRDSWVTGNVGDDSSILTGDFTIERSVVSANEGDAVVEGFQEDSAGHVIDSTLDENSGTVITRCCTGSGRIDVVNSRFESNDGAAIDAPRHQVDVEDSFFRKNHGQLGGAIGAGSVTTRSSSFVGNTAHSGGAVYGDAFVRATNSTFALNEADIGSAISSPFGSGAVLDHVTVHRNITPYPGAQVSALDLRTHASIFGGEPTNEVVCDIARPVESLGANLDTSTTCDLSDPTDRSAIDVRLGAIRDNGSGRPTVMPLAGSPALDRVPTAYCSVPDDGRGVPRPVGAGCDSGAVEQTFAPRGYRDIPERLGPATSWIASPLNRPVILPALGAGRFGPDRGLNRLTAVRLLYRAAGTPNPNRYGSCEPYTDVFELATCWANAEDIVTGYSDGTFRPGRAVSRIQWVRMLHRFSGRRVADDLRQHGFVDVPASSTPVRWVAGFRLMNGYPGHRFRPGTQVTRGQAASSLWRLAITRKAWIHEPSIAMPASPMVGQGHGL